ncbi:MAG: calcium/sodium antiporter [Deltaproteobacteria bacterium]|nr:calcium/sodium antiporter [Candidatus Tharpella aukensis]
MMIAAAALIGGLLTLVWSADLFVEGAAGTARHFGMPPLLIGMVVVGFGTSAPEMVVSTLAAAQGNPGLALGNAYGSNITNIALILGVTALINPITVHSQVLRKELPLLIAITGLAAFQLRDGELTRIDAWILLGVLGGVLFWTIRQGLRERSDTLAGEMTAKLETDQDAKPLKQTLFKLMFGLVLLVISSRILVWGAVKIAHNFGVSDLIIGLTIVALGTSLPELASSVMATCKGEHDIALGNVLGSNFFNTLAVVGIAGVIHPTAVAPEVFSRDMLVMGVLTLLLFVFGFRFHCPGRINRFEGAVLLASYVGYMAFLGIKTFNL